MGQDGAVRGSHRPHPGLLPCSTRCPYAVTRPSPRATGRGCSSSWDGGDGPCHRKSPGSHPGVPLCPGPRPPAAVPGPARVTRVSAISSNKQLISINHNFAQLS